MGTRTGIKIKITIKIKIRAGSEDSLGLEILDLHIDRDILNPQSVQLLVKFNHRGIVVDIHRVCLTL